MKKIYFAPQTTSVALNMNSSILLGSITSNGDSGATVTPSDDEYEGDDWATRSMGGMSGDDYWE